MDERYVDEVKSQTTICDEHKAEYFNSGYEAGKRDAMDQSLRVTNDNKTGPIEEESFEVWSRRQIKKLSAIINDEVFNRMGNRIARIESTRFEVAGRILERVTALENGSRLIGTGGLVAEIMDRLSKLEADRTEMARAIDWVSEELAGTDKAVSALNDRVSQLESSRPRWSDQVSELSRRIDRFAATIDELGDRIRRGEGQTTFETSEDDARLREVDRRVRGLESKDRNAIALATMRQEAYDRGLSAGESRTLGEACDRLREWMGAAFTTSTTEAAVRVVRGEPMPDAKRVITEENPLI